MSGSKAEILDRIRHALGHRTQAAPDDHAAIARAYQVEGTLDEPQRVALFIDRLEHYQVGVYGCANEDIAATVARALTANGKHRVVVPHDVDHGWLPPGVEFVPDLELTYRDLDVSDGVLTACTLGIAFTGSLVLCHGRGQGRRALSLIPDYHLCVIGADQIVETVPEAIRRLQALRPAIVTTIAGPSATADIEMTRIRGVHGPRTLEVIVAAG